jgi:hypothetical protein
LPVPPLEAADFDAQHGLLVEEWCADRRQSTPPSEIWRVLLNSPDGFRTVGKLGAFVRMGTTLPQELRVIASFVASSQRAYSFEVSTQHENLSRLGWEKPMIDALAQAQFQDLPAEAAVVARLAFTVADRHPVDTELLDGARSLFGDQATVEAVLVAAYFCMLADVALTLSGG